MQAIREELRHGLLRVIVCPTCPLRAVSASFPCVAAAVVWSICSSASVSFIPVRETDAPFVSGMGFRQGFCRRSRKHVRQDSVGAVTVSVRETCRRPPGVLVFGCRRDKYVKLPAAARRSSVVRMPGSVWSERHGGPAGSCRRKRRAAASFCRNRLCFTRRFVIFIA